MDMYSTDGYLLDLSTVTTAATTNEVVVCPRSDLDIHHLSLLVTSFLSLPSLFLLDHPGPANMHYVAISQTPSRSFFSCRPLPPTVPNDSVVRMMDAKTRQKRN